MTGNAIGFIALLTVFGLMFIAVLCGGFADVHPNWTIDARDEQGRRDPYQTPEFWSRRFADRYARRNSYDGYVCTVVASRRRQRQDTP